MKLALLTLSMALFSAFPFVANAMDKTAAPVKAVAFHSDNCGSCKILGPKMKEALSKVSQDDVKMVKLDFTDKQTIEASKTLATKNNLNHLLKEYGAKTGFAVLVDHNGDVVDTIKASNSVEEITAKISKAIAHEG